PPYAADTPMGIAMRHITDPIPRIRQLNPGLPKQIERVIRRAMAKSPQDRYQTAAELAGSLTKDEAWMSPVVAKWSPPIQSDTLAGQAVSVDSSGAPPGTAEAAGRERLRAPLEGEVQPSPLRRVPRRALAAGAVLGFLVFGAAFAAGVTGGLTRTPTPSPRPTELAATTQQSGVVLSPTRPPSQIPTASPTTTATATATFMPRPSSTDVPVAAPPSSTPPPTQPPTDTPAPPATDTEVPAPGCTPPEIICEPE
ncbi:MAG: hypothetical protein ACRDHG_02125, partial [Anaerolineales bacterium]